MDSTDQPAPPPDADALEGVDLTKAAVYGLFPRCKECPEEQLTAEALTAGYKVEYREWGFDQFDELRFSLLTNEDALEKVSDQEFEKRLLGTLERAQQTAQRGSRPQPLRVPEVPPGETGELLVQPEILWKAPQNALPALCASVSESARAEWMRRLSDGAAPLPVLAAQGVPFAGMARPTVWDALSKASVPVPRALWLVRLVYASRSSARGGPAQRPALAIPAGRPRGSWGEEGAPPMAAQCTDDLLEHLAKTPAEALGYSLRLVGSLSCAGLVDAPRCVRWLVNQLASPGALGPSERLGADLLPILVESAAGAASHADVRRLCDGMLAAGACRGGEGERAPERDTVADALRHSIGVAAVRCPLALVPWEPDGAACASLTGPAERRGTPAPRALRSLFREQARLSADVQARVLRWTSADVGAVLDGVLTGGSAAAAAGQLLALERGPRRAGGDDGVAALVAATCDWAVADPVETVWAAVREVPGVESSSNGVRIDEPNAPAQSRAIDPDWAVRGRRLVCAQAALTELAARAQESGACDRGSFHDGLCAWAGASWNRALAESGSGGARRQIVRLLLLLAQPNQGAPAPLFSRPRHLAWVLSHETEASHRKPGKAVHLASTSIELLRELPPELCAATEAGGRPEAGTAPAAEDPTETLTDTQYARLWRALTRGDSTPDLENVNDLRPAADLPSSTLQLAAADEAAFFDEAPVDVDFGDDREEDDCGSLLARARMEIEGSHWELPERDAPDTSTLAQDLRRARPWKQRVVAGAVARWAASRAQDGRYAEAALSNDSSASVRAWVGRALELLAAAEAPREVTQVLPRLAAPLLQAQVRVLVRDPGGHRATAAAPLLLPLLGALEAWAAPLALAGVAVRVLRMATAALWLLQPQARPDRAPDPDPVLRAQLRLARRLHAAGQRAGDAALTAWRAEVEAKHKGGGDGASAHWLFEALDGEWPGDADAQGENYFGVPSSGPASQAAWPDAVWEILASGAPLALTQAWLEGRTACAFLSNVAVAKIALAAKGGHEETGDDCLDVIARALVRQGAAPAPSQARDLTARLLDALTPWSVRLSRAVLRAALPEPVSSTALVAPQELVRAVERAPSSALALSQLVEAEEGLLNSLQAALRDTARADHAEGLVTATLFCLGKASAAQQRAFADRLLDQLRAAAAGFVNADCGVSWGPAPDANSLSVPLLRLHAWLRVLFPLLPLVYQDRGSPGGFNLRAKALSAAGELTVQLAACEPASAGEGELCALIQRRLLVAVQALLMGGWAPWLRGSAERKLREVPPFDGAKAFFADLRQTAGAPHLWPSVQDVLSAVQRMLPPLVTAADLVPAPRRLAMISADDSGAIRAGGAALVDPWLLFEGGWPSSVTVDQSERAPISLAELLIRDAGETEAAPPPKGALAAPWLRGAPCHTRLPLSSGG